MTQANDLDGLRGRLEETRGREYWRSLEALSETAEFKDFLHREFPQNASEWLDPVGRRGFLKLMGASLALAGATGCTRQPHEELVPYVRQPEEEVPGKPLFYATAMPMNGAGMGLLVETHEGRPTKIEGNPDHPSSHGPPTCSRRRRFSASTTRTARRRSPTSATSARSARLSPPRGR